MIAHDQEERVVASEIPGAEDGVTVSEGLGLLDESDLIEVVGNGGGEVSFGAGGDDDGSRLNPAREDLIEEKSGDRFIFAGWTDERLEREMLLVEACCRDDRFLNLHDAVGRVMGKALIDKREGGLVGMKYAEHPNLDSLPALLQARGV